MKANKLEESGAVAFRYLRLLRDAANHIGILETEDAIAQVTAEHARRAFDCECVVVLLAEREGARNFRVAACTPRDRSHHLPDLMHIAIERAEKMALLQPIQATDLAGICPSGEAAYRDFLFTPVEAGGAVRGLLGLRRKGGRLGAAELEFLWALGTVAGAALEQVYQRRRAVEDECRRRRLSRHFSPQVVDRLLTQGEGALPKASRCEATVLFCEIRDFSGLSEGHDPAEVLKMLNTYFGEMASLVFGHEGMIARFSGSGLLAAFGAPLPLANHASAAFACAREMVQATHGLDSSRLGFKHPSVGVGLNTGPVLAGALGTRALPCFTLLGATVSIATCIENLTAEYGAEIILTETTKAGLKHQDHLNPLGPIPVRGLRDTVPLYKWEPVLSEGAF